MEKAHATNDASINKYACIRNGRKLRITDKTIAKSKEVMSSIISEVESEPRKRTMTAETVVQANIEGINYLRAQGYSIERIHEVFAKRIKLGISPSTFARYVRRASGGAVVADSAPASSGTDLPQAAEPAPVVDAGWNCHRCQSSALLEDCGDKEAWVCQVCDTAYLAGPDGKISSTRLSG